MKNISKLAIVAACAILAACGSGADETNNMDANMMDMNAGMTDLNSDLNLDMNADMNAMNMDLNTEANADMNAMNNMDMNAAGNNAM